MIAFLPPPRLSLCVGVQFDNEPLSTVPMQLASVRLYLLTPVYIHVRVCACACVRVCVPCSACRVHEQPEPLRWLGINAGTLGLDLADKEEAITGKPSVIAKIVGPIVGH